MRDIVNCRSCVPYFWLGLSGGVSIGTTLGIVAAFLVVRVRNGGNCTHEWNDRGYPHWPRCVKCGAYPPASDEPFTIPDGPNPVSGELMPGGDA